MAPFYGWGSTVLRLHTEPLQGGSLLFTTQSPRVSGTHLNNFNGMKG